MSTGTVYQRSGSGENNQFSKFFAASSRLKFHLQFFFHSGLVIFSWKNFLTVRIHKIMFEKRKGEE